FSVSSSGRYEDSEFTLRIYPGSLAEGTIYCPVSARKSTTAAEAIERCLERLRLDRDRCYVLAEVKEFGGEEWILNPSDCPVQRMMLWPRGALEQRSGSGSGEDYRFLLRQKNLDGSIHYGGSLQMWLRVTEERRRMTERGLLPQEEARGDHADLCCLPELTERSLLDNLRSRFRQERIYTYVGSILIVINPFQFLPIYNPKYVKMYDNHALGDLEPHIYAVADVAYHAMLQRRRNQCIVISGESGSGKTQSTNFLIHHLTALSQKGFASGVEQIILGAGPVLEAFGNAKTAHNNNSSRFGKFIQVNYQESGTVRGAYVEKYLLEKSRLVYQEHNERNYHVFYYLLAGASEEERSAFHLKKPEEYHYLNQVRDPPKWLLQLAMEMVGFLPATRKQIFSLLSAILHLGNIRYKKKTYRDDSIDICNPEVLPTVSELLEVKEEMLFEALTTRKTMTVGERLIVPYKLAEVRPSQQHKPETHPKHSEPLVQRRGTVKYSTLPQDYNCILFFVIYTYSMSTCWMGILSKSFPQSRSFSTSPTSIYALIPAGHLSSSGSNMEEDGGIFVNSTSSKLLERAHGILMRNKNYKSKPSLPKHLLDVKSLKYLSNLTLHDRITKSLLHLHKKKKPPSISAQFQASLNKLMETLGQSEPYFVKCIRSNAEKLPLRFNDGLVLRQLRYTGMLETVRIRQSGYSIKYTFQDFIRHFRVLLPEGTSATQEGIGQYLGQVDLAPDGYQVGKTMVFLREVERQRLQALLHREVLNRIVTLQRRFRALLERKHFISMRLAATTIQKWWRAYQSKQEEDYDPSIQEGAALCIQTAWRGYKERWRFGLWREAALLLQREWRALLKRREREGAALAIQTAWRCHMARKAYLRLRGTMALLQAVGKGYLARQSFGHLKEQRLREKEQRLRDREKKDDHPVRIMGLDLSTWEDRSYKERERSLQRLNSQEERVKEGRGVEIGGEGGVARAAESSGRAQSEPPPVSSTAAVVVRERTRTLDEPCQKTTRAKRESRRMRELEQAKFSLELLKVRATGSGGASSPSEERRWSAELAPTTTPPHRSPQGPGTPDSQSSKGSFELLSMDDEILGERAPLADEEELGSPLSSEVQLEQAPEVSLVSKEPPRASVRDGSAQTGESPSSPRLPVPAPVPPLDPAPVIPISGPTPVPAANQLVLEKLERLNEEKEERQRHLQQQNEREMMDQIRKQKEVLERQRHHFAQSATAATSPRPLRPSSLLIERAQPNKTQPNQAWLPPPPSAPKTKTRDGRPIADGWAPNLTLESREGGGGGARGRVPKKAPANQGTSISMTDMSENIFFAPKDRVAPCLVSTGPKEESSVHWPVCECVSTVVISFLVNQVSRAGHRKKARMARTRSDFLTRTPTSSLGGESEEDEYDGKPPLSSPPPYAPTIPKQESFECFSDSEMVKKTDPYLNLGLHPNSTNISSHWDGHLFPLLLTLFRQDYMSPPRSPDLTLERGAKEFKENKEPSPKVKRRRSVKISSVALEPAQWGNDALQILTCTNDYRSMNDFLMKKISDLVAEDGGKKDTMVDVVFKKALKEFRLNIFNSYSTALAMDDGKSIRYKDLYALFEQILEKTMRLEQRDWSESPVKVWVNTFKIFLDEFMTEYKPMDSTISKVPKTERKKRRKKDADIVEEHNGHIFKATQYSIPTYCEYCSSLIWMMDRACVCKLCRYACHRKCCLKLTTKCSKKYDPELSSRQFGVEVSRLTNEERTVPLVVEKLINYIEMHGLYTEGIYRKSGSTNKIKELKQGLDTDVNGMNLDDYNIHVIASVFKQWLRDLPNPLMTFELYEEFLRAMCLQDKKEVIRGVYSIIDQLSRTHLNTLERLFFHLVRIAGQEDTNRMSANALAIVFAPCILRCPDTIDPLQSVQDIGKTTACVELIIGEQMNKYCARLKDINSLEFAENKAKCRLTLIRRSMKPVLIAVRFMTISRSSVPGKGHVRRFSYHTPSPPVSPRLPSVTGAVMQESGGEEVGVGLEPEVSEQQQLAMQQEERVLTEQIESLQKEKEELTFEMLTLEQRASDDETLESEVSIGTADSSENLNVDTEGREPTLAPVARTKRSEGKSHRRRNLRRQPDSQDSVDSCSTISSLSSSSHFHPSSSSSAATARHFRYRSKSPSSGSAQGLYLTQPPRCDSMDCPPPAKQEGVFEERSQFTSRGTFNPEKGKQKLKGSKNSPLRHSHDSGGRSRDPPDLPQQRVLYGSNEFMV
uniref:Myosin IXA n=1 Tax=Salmo trutta TaxID=8032 RepID=A0A674CK97_SALTR